MSLDDFWNSTPKELYHAFDSYNSDLDVIRKDTWELTRLQTYFIIGDGKLTYKKFCRMFPIPGEQSEEVIIPTKEEWKILQETYNNILKGHSN